MFLVSMFHASCHAFQKAWPLNARRNQYFFSTARAKCAGCTLRDSRAITELKDSSLYVVNFAGFPKTAMPRLMSTRAWCFGLPLCPVCAIHNVVCFFANTTARLHIAGGITYEGCRMMLYHSFKQIALFKSPSPFL